MKIPLAIVGVTFRDAPTHVRDAALRCDSGTGGDTLENTAVTAQLIARGHATGVVRLETCSRVEWIISSPEPRWAAELLRSALLAKLVPLGVEARSVRSRSGYAAAHYLCRVTTGLDSLAEGEAAVARQVLKAFSDAHSQKRTDRLLNLLWNQLGKLVHHKRQLISRPGIGVQKLVLDELLERGPARPVVIFGRGTIGRSIDESLRNNGFTTSLYSRAERAAFDEAVATASTLVMASGAPAPWLVLPQRHDHPTVIDVGSPSQIVKAPGWNTLGLDELLSRPGCLMTDEELARLDALIDAQLLELAQRLSLRTNEALGELEQFRTDFVDHVLTRLNASVSDPEVMRDIRRDITEATHALVLRTKGSAP